MVVVDVAAEAWEGAGEERGGERKPPPWLRLVGEAMVRVIGRGGLWVKRFWLMVRRVRGFGGGIGVRFGLM